MPNKRKTSEETTTISVINRAKQKASPGSAFCASNLGVSFLCKRERCTEDQLLTRALCKKTRARSSTSSFYTTISIRFFDDGSSSSDSEAPSAEETYGLVSQKIAKIVEEFRDIPQRVRKWYNATRVNWKERPLGLPEKVSLDTYRANPICQLSGYNYKVNAKIVAGKRDGKYFLSALDTGAGPSLIWKDVCPPLTLANIDTSREVVNLRSASNHSLEVLGVATLTVTVGAYSAITPVVVVRRLGADFLLGCSYIYYHVSAIMTRRRAVVMLDNTWGTIQRRQALNTIEESLPEKKVLGSRADSSFNSIRVAITVNLRPNTQSYVEVTSNTQGLRIIEGRADLWEKKKIATLSGMAEVTPDKKFLFQVANFSTSVVTLQKGERLGTLLPVPIPVSSSEAQVAD